MRPCRRLLVVPIALCATIAACGDSQRATPEAVTDTSQASSNTTRPTGDGFCEAMSNLIVLLAPTDNSSPDETSATFTEAAGWFDQARSAAPAVIAADVASYAAAYDEYIQYLGTVDFNLTTVFSTPEGKQLAIDTSHSLTPAIVQYAIDVCGLSFGDEEHPPPTTA